MNNLLGNIQVLYSPWSYPPHLHWIVFFIWKQLSGLLSKSYLYGIEVDFDTSILTYEYKYHFHLVNQMYGTEVDFDTCILFQMLIRIVLPGSVQTNDWIYSNMAGMAISVNPSFLDAIASLEWGDESQY